MIYSPGGGGIPLGIPLRESPQGIRFLIGLFLGISAYLIQIGYHFIGLVYLVVYIGAIFILFLFILMLLSVRSSELEHLTYFKKFSISHMCNLSI
uniref:NADH-ubiquinone oxidoreductase chain 6 n=1 Tax=Ophiognomonia clavigignenti-juglandacearum TaxID=218668 RepID=A0A291LJ68_9PEZI|nr:NADH dehydrogenase subunit 6 [Ophiognomonia clavigignenti-juglandacearum]